MRTIRWFCALAAVAFLAPAVPAQPPKPGAEHEVLKKLEGDWTLVMKAGGADSKGSVAYKMELGGMWLVGSLEAELFGQKFQGKSLDTYDAGKKKYVSVWVDSTAPYPVMMEGAFDKEKKTLTMSGEGPGMDGKTKKYKSVTTYTDDDTINYSMYGDDAKEAAFTIVYSRKKK